MKQKGFLRATSVMSILFCMIVLCQLKQICDNEVKILAVLHIFYSHILLTIHIVNALHHDTVMIVIFVNHVVIIELQLY